MSGTDIEWTEVEMSVTGGLNEGVDPRVLPPGQMVVAENCDFSVKAGQVAKRPGLVMVSNPPSAGGPPAKLAVHTQRNQLLGIDQLGSTSVLPKVYAYTDAIADGDDSFAAEAVGDASDVLIQRKALTSDLRNDIVSDMAYVKGTGNSGFLVYGLLHVQTKDILVKVVQTRKGTIHEPEHVVLEKYISYSRVGGDAIQVRAAPFGDTHVLVTWGRDLGTIEGVVVDCSGGATPTVSALTQLVNDAGLDQGRYHDTAESTVTTGLASGTPNWILGYQKFIPPGVNTQQVVRLLRLQYVGTTLSVVYGTDVHTVVDGAVRAISVMEKNGNAWLNWWDSGTIVLQGEGPEWTHVMADSAWRYAVRATNGGASVRAATAYAYAANIGSNYINNAGWISAIGVTGSDTAMMMFHSQHAEANLVYPYATTSPNGFFDRHITRFSRCDTSGGTWGTPVSWGGVYLLSKPWHCRTTTAWMAWCGTNLVGKRSGFKQTPASTERPIYTRTAVLLKFDEEAHNDQGVLPTKLVGTAAGQTLGDPMFQQQAVAANDPWVDRGAQQAQSITYGSYNAVTPDLQAIGYRTSFNVRHVPNEEKSAPWDIVVRDTQSEEFPQGYSRHLSAMYGGSVYMTGGVLTQWDGERHAENNFVRAPNLQVELASSGAPATWDAAFLNSRLFFQVVFETVMPNGERTRSAASQVVEVEIGAVGDKTFKFWIDMPPATLRDIGPSVASGSFNKATPRTIAVLYGSDEPESSSLHRIYEFTDDFWANMVVQPGGNWIEIQLNGSIISGPVNTTTSPYAAALYSSTLGNDIGSLETVYSDSGELENDMPHGGCSAMAVHKDRLWVGGGEDPEVIWYSKESADGRPAEFALGQHIRIPGVEVRALASVGESLLVFCKNTIFSVVGEGPNATGDPASGVFFVRPINTTLGATSQSSVTAIPGGALFYSGDDLYGIDASGTVQRLGGNVEDSYNRTAFTTSLVQYKRQVRIPVGGAFVNETPSKVLVFDWEAGLWATWTYVFADAEGALNGANVVDVKELNGRVYYLNSAGRLYRESRESIYADDNIAYTQCLKTGWLSFGRVQGHKMLRHVRILQHTNPWAAYAGNETAFPFGYKVTMNFNYSDTFTASRQWTSYELGAIQSQDSPTWLGVHFPYQKQPSVQLELKETNVVQYINGPTQETFDTSSGDDTLKLTVIQSNGSSRAISLTVSPNPAMTAAQLVAELTALLPGAGLIDDDQIEFYVFANRQLGIRTKFATSFTIDSYASGSTLNTPVGFAAGGEAELTPAVAAADRSGFILQSLAFEVGQVRGNRRLPAAQIR